MRGAQLLNRSQIGFESLEARRLLAGTPAVWTGANGDQNWSTADNWQGNVVPASGQDVIFPAIGSATDFVNVDQPVTVGSLSLDTTAMQGAGPITLQGDITTADAHLSAILTPVVLTHDATAAVPFDLILGGVISDGGNQFGLTLNGGGQVDIGNYVNTAGTIGLAGQPNIIETYTGPTLVDDVALYSFGTIPSDVQAQNNSGVYSTGTLGGLSSSNTLVEPADTFNGIPGTLTLNQGLVLDNNTALMLYAKDASHSNRINVTSGTIDLGDAVLQTDLPDNYIPAIGTSFTLIHNQTGQPIQHTLSGLADGAYTTLGGVLFHLTYHGGDSGNDLVLTASLPPSHITLSSSLASSILGQKVRFSVTVTGTDTNNNSPGGTVQFYAGTMPLGAPVQLSGGTASILTGALAIGSHVINAAYSGDAHFSSTNALADATALTQVVQPPVSFVSGHSVTTKLHKVTLSVLGADLLAPGEAGLIYTWRLLSYPKGAKKPLLSRNGTHAARSTSVRVSKAGRYIFRCTATDSEGNSAALRITLTVTA